MRDGSLTFRTANFSRRHRDRLEEAAELIESVGVMWSVDRQLLAEDLRAIGRRWDENPETEATIGEPIASRRV